MHLSDHISRVSCQKGPPTGHAYAWQIGRFGLDTLDLCVSTHQTTPPYTTIVNHFPSLRHITEHKHEDVIKWKHFPRYWPFVRGINRSPVNSPHKGQWCGALMFYLIYTWTNGWVNNRDAGGLRRHCAHYDVIVIWKCKIILLTIQYSLVKDWLM